MVRNDKHNTFSQGLKVQSICFKTSGSPSLYLRSNPSNSTLPSVGQSSLGRLSGYIHSASVGVSEYSFTRSTDTIFVSSSLVCRTIQLSELVTYDSRHKCSYKYIHKGAIFSVLFLHYTYCYLLFIGNSQESCPMMKGYLT